MPWGRNHYNDTTTKNLSEVTVVSPRYDDSNQTRTSNAGYQNRTRTTFTHQRDDASTSLGGPNQQWQADLVDVSRLKNTEQHSY